MLCHRERDLWTRLADGTGGGHDTRLGILNWGIDASSAS